MARSIFSLVGRIRTEGLDTLSKGLLDIDKKLAKTARKVDKFGRNVSQLGANITKVTAPIAAAGVGLLALATQSGKAADRLLDLKEVTGLSTDTLQELKNVAADAGVDFEGFIGTVSKLSNSMPEIIKGTGPAAEAIEQLGVNVLDSAGEMRDMNQLFPELLNALRKVENTTERNAMAQDLFGRSLDNLAPVLGMTSEQFEAVRKEAHAMGAVIGEDALVNANEFRKGLDKLQNQVMSLAIGIGAELAPVFQEVLFPIIRDDLVPIFISMVNKIKEGAKWFSSLSESAKRVVLISAALVTGIGPVLLITGKLISSITILSTTFTALRTVVIALNAAFLGTPIGWIVLGVAAVSAAVYGAVKAYKALNQERQTSITLIKEEKDTLEGLNDGQKDFVKAVRAYDEWLAKSKAMAINLHGVAKAQEIQAKGIDDLARRAEKLGFIIEGTNEERLKALQTISAEIQGLKDSEGYLIRYTGRTKDSADAIKQRNKALEEWNAKLRDQAASELEAVEIKRQAAKEELSIKERTGETLARIDEFYDNERQKLLVEQAKRDHEASAQAIKLAEDKRSAEEKYLDSIRIATAEANKDELAALRMRRDAELSAAEEQLTRIDEIEQAKDLIRQKYKEREVELAKQAEAEKSSIRQAALAAEKFFGDQRVQMAQGMVSDLGELGRMQTNNELTRLQQQSDADRERIQNSTMSEAEKQKALLDLEEQTQRKRVQLQRRQAIREKALGIFGAVVGTAEAVAKALTAGPIMGPIMAAIVGAMGAAKVALIQSQPLPQLADGGLIRSRSGGMDVTVGEGAEDELVLPMRRGAEELAQNIVRAIGNLASPFTSPAPSLAAAGPGFGSARPVQHVWNIGTLIADDFGMKELERRLLEFRVAEEKRKGSD